jgi:hypothetical protein
LLFNFGFLSRFQNFVPKSQIRLTWRDVSLKSWCWVLHWKAFGLQSNLCTTATLGTWKKAAVWQRCLIKLGFRLVVDDSNWPLLTGGCCSQLVVKSGLTVLVFFNFGCLLSVYFNLWGLFSIYYNSIFCSSPKVM